MFLGFYDYTVVLTYISLGISVFGITMALEGNFKMAIFCLALSGLCDMFDGKIARTKKNRTEDEKNFGIQIDSLCDVVCFGVFPVMICYCLGVNTPAGVASLIFYSIASVIRLAYFNVTEAKRQTQTEENRKYYQGLPITSMAIILPFLYLMRRYYMIHFLIVIHIAVIIVGLLFILNIKVKKPQNPVRILLVVVVALALAKMFRFI
ncbi:CDP-alcohol phosphatidyltransferase family protein [Blautia difficilis]|uniref:CDP-alcohol phosphatidyltransferase family protein n=1 Tax=Blautia difficilis TaxID=2763027 RepID=A0ABR7IL77_9FIRM|nr:CDP-alcohol phosphatidyltransferase family protein [Blautia difficilis]MBC5780702.1 CDP-alcohol phosphatidyltransferase family protein [Blautia difficilis]